MDRGMLKTNAKADLKECKTNPYMVTFIYLIVGFIISGVSNKLEDSNSIGAVIATLVIGLISCAIGAGFSWWTMSIVRNNDDIGEFKLAFIKILKVFVVSLIVGVITFVGFILLIVPGAIAVLGLSMSMRCLRDDPDMGCIAAIKESWRIMNGHKWEYFVLGLSFIPWALLTGITLGIAGIYTIPYMETTYSEFYEAIKE